jgi:hypothetical protein
MLPVLQMFSFISSRSQPLPVAPRNTLATRPATSSESFLLVALHKLRHGVNDSVRGPDCPVPPWSRTVGEPRGVRGFFHFREWVCIKRKGQASGAQPGPNNRVFRGFDSWGTRSCQRHTVPPSLRQCKDRHDLYDSSKVNRRARE